MSANDRQVGGSHYKSGLQHWDMLIGLGFGPQYFIGQATKYISRWRKKNGLPDLKKGQHFVDKLIELVKEYGEGFLPYMVVHVEDANLEPYFESNGIPAEDQKFLEVLVAAQTLEELEVMNRELMMFISMQSMNDFEFIRYTDNDTIMWRRKSTRVERELGLNVPPTSVEWV